MHYTSRCVVTTQSLCEEEKGFEMTFSYLLFPRDFQIARGLSGLTTDFPARQ
jgi:hypothetical protein